MKKKKIKISKADRIYYGFCYAIAVLLTLIVLIPIMHILAVSFSSPSAVSSGKVTIFPTEFSVQAYRTVLAYQKIWIGYRNTIIYTAVGTFLSVFVTMLAAYPLSRKEMYGRKGITLYFTFIMFFGGGIIPGYLLMKSLRLLNTPIAAFITGLFSTYNMIVARTFIQTNISGELTDAAKIDGAGDIKIFHTIVLPLSKTIIAVIALWNAVGFWNSYFTPFIYINDNNLYPLQLFLREILVSNDVSTDLINMEMAAEIAEIKKLMKYSVIVVSTAPLMFFYPFAQKHFVKGVMIGSVKG